MFEIAKEREELNLPFAIVTIVETKGIVPRKNSRMLVLPDGSCFGTVGGGSVERFATKEALNALEKGKGGVIKTNTPKGEVTMMIDLPTKGRSLHIIGGGHVGLEIARLMYKAGYAIYLYDIHNVEFKNAAKITIAPTWSEALKEASFDSSSAIIVAVHEKSEIEPFLKNAKAFYIGFLSSREKAVKQKENIFVPLGLDIGAETPEEIAISVSAEIIATASSHSALSLSKRNRSTILVRGAGDLATGVIIKLHNAGYDVIATEIEEPTQIRRSVSFAEAIYQGECTVEGVKAISISSPSERFALFDEGIVPILKDPNLHYLDDIRPLVVVDAILAKKNLGTTINMAPFVVALGPGFEAGLDADVVIETMRGHELGRIIKEGKAKENTGVPGLIAGYGKERVVRSPKEGIFRGIKTFGDIVAPGEIIAYVDETPVKTVIGGMVRGMLHEGLHVTEGFKVADVDPRGEGVDYKHVSDKARCIAGGVLEAIDGFVRRCFKEG